MSKLSTSQPGAIILNSIAVFMTLAPIVSMVWFGALFLAPDTRQVEELSIVASAPDPRLFQEPLVSVTFDDGWESIYSEAAPIMSRYDIVSTQYILPGTFADKNYMSVDQVSSLKQAGHEITSHTYSHRKLTSLSSSDVAQELELSKQILQKYNLIDNEPNFAAPLGAVNPTVTNAISKQYYSSRNTYGNIANGIDAMDVNLAGSFDRYNIMGYSAGQYTTDDDFRAAIAYTQANNGWFVPIYHQIDYSGERYSVTPETFERHMRIIKESGIKTATMRDVLQRNKGVK